jgi:hypothetical protein
LLPAAKLLLYPEKYQAQLLILETQKNAAWCEILTRYYKNSLLPFLAELILIHLLDALFTSECFSLRGLEEIVDNRQKADLLSLDGDQKRYERFELKGNDYKDGTSGIAPK